MHQNDDSNSFVVTDQHQDRLWSYSMLLRFAESADVQAVVGDGRVTHQTTVCIPSRILLTFAHNPRFCGFIQFGHSSLVLRVMWWTLKSKRMSVMVVGVIVSTELVGANVCPTLNDVDQSCEKPALTELSIYASLDFQFSLIFKSNSIKFKTSARHNISVYHCDATGASKNIHPLTHLYVHGRREVIWSSSLTVCVYVSVSHIFDLVDLFRQQAFADAFLRWHRVSPS